MSNFINLVCSKLYSYEKNKTTKRLLEAQEYLQSRLVVVRSVYVVVFAQIDYVWYHKLDRVTYFYIQEIKRK